MPSKSAKSCQISGPGALVGIVVGAVQVRRLFVFLGGLVKLTKARTRAQYSLRYQKWCPSRRLGGMVMYQHRAYGVSIPILAL